MVNGKIGAGKTTVSKLIASKLPAFRISHDEMLVAAYGPEMPTKNFQLRCERMNDLAWEIAAKMTKLGVSVVMEGWGSGALRNQARRELNRIGVAYEFIYVTCPPEQRRQRVLKRNHNLQGENYRTDEAEFDRMNALDEEIREDERFIFCANETPDRDPDLAFLDTVRAR